MDATETLILVSFFLLAAVLIAVPRMIARRDRRREGEQSP
jgi:hypothetical protein